MATVYVHTVIKNGKKYVGQCNGDPKIRWGSNGYRYKGSFFYSAIAKYGWKNIDHEIIATNLSQKEADELEKKLIQQYKTNDKEYGYNLTPGGKDGAGLPGGRNPNAKAVICLETGKTWECANFCAKELGVNPASLQESLYNGYRCKGFHFKYADDGNYIPNKDPYKVRCVETGEIWDSVKICAKALGLDKRTIAHYCRGERRPKSGLTYEYYVA